MQSELSKEIPIKGLLQWNKLRVRATNKIFAFWFCINQKQIVSASDYLSVTAAMMQLFCQLSKWQFTIMFVLVTTLEAFKIASILSPHSLATAVRNGKWLISSVLWLTQILLIWISGHLKDQNIVPAQPNSRVTVILTSISSNWNTVVISSMYRLKYFKLVTTTQFLWKISMLPDG